MLFFPDKQLLALAGRIEIPEQTAFNTETPPSAKKKVKDAWQPTTGDLSPVNLTPKRIGKLYTATHQQWRASSNLLTVLPIPTGLPQETFPLAGRRKHRC